MGRRKGRLSPPGVTSIEGDTGFVIWNVGIPGLESILATGTRDFLVAVERADVSGVSLDLDGSPPPTDVWCGGIVRIVDALQSEGRGVVLHSAPGDFLTALALEGDSARIPTTSDLTSAVALLRGADAQRRDGAQGPGRRGRQLRMPARAASLAPLVAYTRGRLEQADAPQGVIEALLAELYPVLCGILATGREPGESDLFLGVTVLEERASVTLLDAGRPRQGETVRVGDRVDRIHSFRILDRHNAVVLEKDFDKVAMP
jgi:hypothetical protein